ncbi:MAG: hypothetical protein PHD72_00460 [Patescibacteria group bacterium]|nr:hypothetical protein [Patescibacteria group bacterium]
MVLAQFKQKKGALSTVDKPIFMYYNFIVFFKTKFVKQFIPG